MGDSVIGKGQHYMTPVTEFYLKDSLGKAELAFVCIDSLLGDVIDALDDWNLEHSLQLDQMQSHKSDVFSSSNLSSVFSRFSPESITWVEEMYAADLQLFES